MTDSKHSRNKTGRRLHALAATVAGAIFMSASVAVVAQPNVVKSLFETNKDGESTYFAVRCSDGRKSQVLANEANGKVCHFPPGGSLKCSSEHSIVKAATLACGGQLNARGAGD